MIKNRKKILVVNLTRMGDILQSSSLLWGLKDKNPDCIIHYLAVDTFTNILKNIPYIDKIIKYDVLNILENVIDNENRNIIEDYFEQETIVDSLREENYNLLINITHTDESKALSFIINAKETVGITSDEKGYRIVKHPWANYFYSSNLNRAINRINLVDIYLRMGNVERTPRKLLFEVTNEAKEKFSQIVKTTPLLQKFKDKYYCIQLGASVENKQYTPKSYSTIANSLYLSHKIIPIFIGTEKERPILSSIEKSLTTPFIDLMGKTSIDTLGEILKNGMFLLTNDTGTMHIASGVNTRIVCIALATAYSHETAAYSENNIIIEADIHCTPCSHQIECLNPICKPLIRPEIVTEIIKETVLSEYNELNSFLDKDISLENVIKKNLGDIKVYITLFDKNNLLRLFPLIKKEYFFEELCHLNYHYLWNLTLGFNDYLFIEINDFKSIAEDIDKELKKWYLDPSDVRSINKKVLKEQKDLKRLIQFANEGIEIVSKLIQYLSDNKITELQENAPHLVYIDDSISEIGFINSNLRGLTFFFQFGKDNLDSSDVKILFDKTKKIYDQLKYRARFMYNIYNFFSK